MQPTNDGTVCACRKNDSAGGVLRQTQYYFANELKPLMALSKVPRTLSVAMEYIALPYKRDQEEPVRKLLMLMRNEYDQKDPKFLKRHPACIKAGWWWWWWCNF